MLHFVLRAYLELLIKDGETGEGASHLFAVGVRFVREGAVHYWGSANDVPRDRFSTDLKAAIFDFDQELFETADAAANHALERVISIISIGR